MGRKIAIVGAAAVGGYAGAHMVRAGEDVTFIGPWPEHVEHMRRQKRREITLVGGWLPVMSSPARLFAQPRPLPGSRSLTHQRSVRRHSRKRPVRAPHEILRYRPWIQALRRRRVLQFGGRDSKATL
jgi:hypothetical protein